MELALYSALIAIGSLVGASIALRSPAGAHTADVFLSLSAGIMIGAVGFDMLPEAFSAAGIHAGYALVAGFVTLLLLERYVLVHICEVHEHAGPNGGCDEPAHRTVGLAAFFGLSLHTITDGLALGSALAIPKLGPTVFAAILVHNTPAAFSLASIFRAERRTVAQTLLLSVAFALMVPAGALLFSFAKQLLDGTHGPQITALTVAFSAGTFLHVAFSDLLPDLHRRGARKMQLSFALVVGVLLMGGLTALV